VGRWLKTEGDTVKKDESLVEIITDKVTAELPSPVSGRLVKILVTEDQTVGVGAAIAEIEESGGAPTTTATSSSQTPAGTSSAGPTASPASASSAGAASNGASMAQSTSRLAQTSVRDRPEKVSPLARRLAQEHQLDLGAIQGSGEGGRVRKEDVLGYLAQGQAATAPMTATAPRPAPAPAAPMPPAPPVPVSAEDEIITPTPARRAIAEHMVRSKRTSPHAITVFEVDMTNLGRWLDRHREAFKQREGYGISFQTFVIKAAVEALKEYPYINASWTEDGKIVLRRQIHIGMSIALNNNLIVPVIRNADTLNLAGIARSVNDIVSRARVNKLMPADMQGATFTVNNPGVFGTLMSMAIINQPNAAILTMDTVEKRPVVVDDAIAIRQMMYMSISFDHRVLDGMTAAQFMGAIKRRLESWGPEIDVY
ncbi:MAG TPA: dihydrolipoamide acetyltransferase family protein, partial [Ktedonobacterales bacterium]|nr:dihydrolipoamide acetyltransferase family protein [Ktedonobacterales bacterium]